ncbi:MAG: GNAT family N-acetyltransferase [Elusimicrobiales bacterium]
MKIKIKIIKKPSNKNISDIKEIYQEAGWLTRFDTNKRISEIVERSYIFVCAFDSDRIVAIARVIADGVNDAYIQDLTVKKDMRNRGIASAILSYIKNYLLKKGFKFIILVSEKGTEKFYQKNGFRYVKGMKVFIYEIK